MAQISAEAFQLSQSAGKEEDELTMIRHWRRNSVPRHRRLVSLLLPKDIPPGL